LFRIIKAIKKQDLSLDRVEMLVYKISGKKSDYVDDLFESLPSLLNINTINTRNAAFQYFAENGLEKYRLNIIELILNSDSPTG
jgi:hypothetical protein